MIQVMKLYKIGFTHYAPKDSRTGTIVFILSDDENGPYEFVKSRLYMDEDDELDSCLDPETDEEDTWKSIVLRHRGTSWEELEDLYYGATHWFWEDMGDAGAYDLETLEKLGLLPRT